MTPSQSRGAATSPPTRSPLWRCRKPEPRRGHEDRGGPISGAFPRCTPTPCVAPSGWVELTSALDLGPGIGPCVVVGAFDVGPTVEALRDRGRPVVDLRGVGRVRHVVAVAE